MLEMQRPEYTDGEYDEMWETWGKSGGNALEDFEEELSEQEGIAEQEIQEWIDLIGYDMPEEIWTIIKETDQEEVLAAILIADTFVSHGTRAFIKREERKRHISIERLTSLLSWFGLGEYNRRTVPKRIARNRAFIMRMLIRGY